MQEETSEIQGIYNYPDQVQGDTVLRKQFRTSFNLTGVSIFVVFSNNRDRIVPDVTIADQTNGIFFIEQFTTVFPGIYKYDIRFTFPNGIVRTYVKGQINILSNEPE